MFNQFNDNTALIVVSMLFFCVFSGGKANLQSAPLRGPLLMSPEVDRHAVSSLELSPSNSSGGTYMWDEEGMEPLGQNSHMHHCSSFESDLNSVVSTHIH